MRGGDSKRKRKGSSKSWKPRSCPSVGLWRVRPSVARDQWHRAWPTIDGTVRGTIDGTVDSTYKQ